jgi:hypothetical protein
MTETKVELIIKLLNEISDNTNAIGAVTTHIEKLNRDKETKRLKLLLNDFNKYKELKKIIDSIEIVEYKYILADYYAEFEYEINLNKNILIRNIGSGENNNLETTISYKATTEFEWIKVCNTDYGSDDNEYFESDVILNNLYELFNLEKTNKKVFKKFICELFSLMVI